MSDDDRPLSFDARKPVRGERAVPVTFLISAGVLVVLIIAVVIAYRGGLGGSGGPATTLGTPVTDMKAPAPADAQPADAAAGLQIYNDENGAPAPTAGQANPNFAAPPEQPQPRPTAGAVPSAAADAPPLPPSAAQPAAPVAARSTPAVAATPAKPLPGPLSSAPPKPAAAQGASTAPGPAGSAAAAMAAPASGGNVSAQVGAFSSAALADQGWGQAVRLAAGSAAGKGKAVEQAQVNGKTVYRALVTGFDSRAAAGDFCSRVTAAGGNCLVH